MKFRGTTYSDGQVFFGTTDKERFTLSTEKGIVLELRINRYVAQDKNDKDVYEGDIVILPKKKFKWKASGRTFDADGSEFRVPFYSEPHPFTIGMLEEIISQSKLNDRRN